jgi:hypothetical protein
LLAWNMQVLGKRNGLKVVLEKDVFYFESSLELTVSRKNPQSGKIVPTLVSRRHYIVALRG